MKSKSGVCKSEELFFDVVLRVSWKVEHRLYLNKYTSIYWGVQFKINDLDHW